MHERRRRKYVRFNSIKFLYTDISNNCILFYLLSLFLVIWAAWIGSEYLRTKTRIIENRLGPIKIYILLLGPIKISSIRFQFCSAQLDSNLNSVTASQVTIHTFKISQIFISVSLSRAFPAKISLPKNGKFLHQWIPS